MNRYKKTFDAVKMPAGHQERIRKALSSAYYTDEKENTILNTKMPVKNIKGKFFASAVLCILIISLVGFTFGSTIIELMGGGRIETGRDKDGNDYVAMDIGFVTDPVETRDGRIYFVLDRQDLDITEACSEESCYRYEYVASNGYKHIVLVGGTPDNLGWAEFVWTADGDFLGGNATYQGDYEPEWLRAEQAGFDN